MSNATKSTAQFTNANAEHARIMGPAVKDLVLRFNPKAEQSPLVFPAGNVEGITATDGVIVGDQVFRLLNHPVLSREFFVADSGKFTGNDAMLTSDLMLAIYLDARYDSATLPEDFDFDADAAYLSRKGFVLQRFEKQTKTGKSRGFSYGIKAKKESDVATRMERALRDAIATCVDPGIVSASKAFTMGQLRKRVTEAKAASGAGSVGRTTKNPAITPNRQNPVEFAEKLNDLMNQAGHKWSTADRAKFTSAWVKLQTQSVLNAAGLGVQTVREPKKATKKQAATAAA